jgi:hypothetical protein
MTQEALPALPNQNDEEAARDEKGPEIFILSLAQTLGSQLNQTRLGRLRDTTRWRSQLTRQPDQTLLADLRHERPRACKHARGPMAFPLGRFDLHR